MVPTKWNTVPWSAMSDEPSIVFLEAAKALGTTREGVLRSDSGLAAVVVSLQALRGSSDVDLRLKASVHQPETIAILLTAETTSDLDAELWELSGAGDLVALPASLAVELPDGFVPRGTMIQHLDSALPDTFEVCERSASKADLLTRGAPVELGEGPDDLGGRADWFKKRHGSDG